MEEVVRGAGEVNLTRSGDTAFDRLRGRGGVSGRAFSVVGIKSCDAWYEGAWKSILPKAQSAQAMRDTSEGNGWDDCDLDTFYPVSRRCSRRVRLEIVEDQVQVVQDAR